MWNTSRLFHPHLSPFHSFSSVSQPQSSPRTRMLETWRCPSTPVKPLTGHDTLKAKKAPVAHSLPLSPSKIKQTTSFDYLFYSKGRATESVRKTFHPLFHVQGWTGQKPGTLCCNRVSHTGSRGTGPLAIIHYLSTLIACSSQVSMCLFIIWSRLIKYTTYIKWNIPYILNEI